MKVAIYGQFYHKDCGLYIEQLLDILHINDIEVAIEEKFLVIINENLSSTYDLETFTSLDESYDLFFSIGGDGTILRSVNYVRNLEIPIVGINTGRLGFLSTIKKETLTHSIISILQGECYFSERTLIEVNTSTGECFSGLNFALNEVTVSRKDTTSMISVDTKVDEEFLATYWADGLIVSTPTGSTGYSLSCGGPIIMPGTSSFLITPIAPHNLNVRPLLLPDKSTISLQVNGREEECLIALDSRSYVFPNNTQIFIKRADFRIKLVLLNETTFFKTLREKMFWGEDRRN